jgi:hypothetical protein
VVLLRVSTAGSRRMIARLLAMRATPIARVMVTTAGSPSGMAPTARATAAVSMSAGDSPRTMPSTKVSSASPRMATVSTWLNREILRVSGVSSVSASPTRRWMRPISVSSPVATTMPRPRPRVSRLVE